MEHSESLPVADTCRAWSLGEQLRKNESAYQGIERSRSPTGGQPHTLHKPSFSMPVTVQVHALVLVRILVSVHVLVLECVLVEAWATTA